MKLDCSLETRTSKAGNSYQCLVVKLAQDYEKVIFLDKAELALINQSNVDLQKGFDPFNND